jgi:hypothetical protein
MLCCFYSNPASSLANRCHPLVKQLSILLTKYRRVDFGPLRGFNMYKEYNTESEMNQDRTTLALAALLHFNMDMATLIQYLEVPMLVPALFSKPRASRHTKSNSSSAGSPKLSWIIYAISPSLPSAKIWLPPKPTTCPSSKTTSCGAPPFSGIFFSFSSYLLLV